MTILSEAYEQLVKARQQVLVEEIQDSLEAARVVASHLEYLHDEMKELCENNPNFADQSVCKELEQIFKNINF